MFQFQSRVVTVIAPGALERFSVAPLYVRSFRLEPLPSNTGRVTLGVVGLDVPTSVGIIKSLAAPAAGASAIFDSYESPQCYEGGNLIDLSQFRLDAAVADEGVSLSYVVA